MPFSLHFETGKVTSQQLYSEIYQGILEGRLRSNERLPSTRLLSKKLGIARNTVISVYERLQFEGWIVKKAGSGTYVSNALEQTVNQDKRPIKHYQLGVFGTNAAKKPEIITPKNLDYDFTLGVPDHQRIAKHIWRHSRLSRLNALTPEFAYGGDLQGLACLRESICEYVRHSRGVICDPEDIIITQGCQQAIMTTLLTLLSPGDLVSTEDPGYPVLRNQARLLGAQIGTVPMDNQGVVVESIPSNTKIIYTTPSHQFPLGFSYSVERKLELLRWAEFNNAIIIEDDYDAEYHYLNTSKQALKSQDKNDCVIMIGSFSKILFPGIRIGYMIPPKSLIEPISNMLWHLGRSTSVVSQILLDEFMRDGHFSHHLLNMNKIYSERYHKLTQLIDNIDCLQRIPSQGGLHIAAEVSGCATQMMNKLASSNVAVYPSSHFSINNHSNALLFGFGIIPTPKIEKAFDIIQSVLD